MCNALSHAAHINAVNQVVGTDDVKLGQRADKKVKSLISFVTKCEFDKRNIICLA